MRINEGSGQMKEPKRRGKGEDDEKGDTVAVARGTADGLGRRSRGETRRGDRITC
jgi:hypothetical protein